MPGRHDAGRIPPGTAMGGPVEAAIWPNGPTRADGRPPPAAMPFSLTLPASPPGTGGGPNTKPAAQRPTTLSEARGAPPVLVLGAERAGGRLSRPKVFGPDGPANRQRILHLA
jgi:hypothetical protein